MNAQINGRPTAVEVAQVGPEPLPAIDLGNAPETTVAGPVEEKSAPMQGRQLFAYFGLLFLLLIFTRVLLLELDSRFDLAIFPKLAAGVQQALNGAAEFDNVLNTAYSLLYALLFSLPVAIVYRVTKDEGRFDPSLSQTIVLLSMVVTAVMIVISGDLARAFGLAGVVSAVRFRNSLDDAKDAVYVFLAIAIGMACGARVYTIALWTSLIMTTVMYLMWRYHFGQLPGRILASREAGKKEKKNRKEKKLRAEGNAHEAAPPVPSLALSTEAQARVARMVEQQFRLVQLAAMGREDGGKKANTGLVVEAFQIGPAQSHVTGVLTASSGEWRLANVIGREGGGGTLEFVGRLSKKATPLSLIEAVMSEAPAAVISSVEVRSLKGQKPLGLLSEPALSGAIPARTTTSPWRSIS